MEKIVSLFARAFPGGDRGLVYNEATPGAEWVVAGEGVATRKWDGTACMVRAGKLYKRYNCKRGKTPPPDFEPCGLPDAMTGHWPGWIPVSEKSDDQWHREAWGIGDFEDGTYELIGPKVQGNPEKAPVHILIRHGREEWPDCPRTFDALREWFKGRDIEGIVWHHPDGRMVKIKKRDFGLHRS